VHCYDYLMTATAPKPIPCNLAAVFLDRDGVLNRKVPEGQYVTSWSGFRILPGVPDAIARLNRAGLLAVVVSNQRGISRSLYTAEDVEAIHVAFQRDLSACGAHIDAFFFCPHDRGQCNCRKPLPGLFQQAQARFPAITAESSVMIGDSLVDMEFAHRLGMTAILIENDPRELRPGTDAALESADLRCKSLQDAVEVLLANH
jgi:D-glycero-D-manno-heptose 1,7-bisphosphate phosphatase